MRPDDKQYMAKAFKATFLPYLGSTKGLTMCFSYTHTSIQRFLLLLLLLLAQSLTD